MPAEPSSQSQEIGRILEAASPPGGHVSSELLPLVYDELRSLARKQLSSEKKAVTLQATALVHEAWLRVSGENQNLWNNRTHFFRTAAQAMRRILVDRAREKASQKRDQTRHVLNIQDLELIPDTLDERVLLIDEVMHRLEQEDPDSTRLITLKFFGGLTNKEIAAMENVTERTIERDWTYAKSKLFKMIREES